MPNKSKNRLPFEGAVDGLVSAGLNQKERLAAFRQPIMLLKIEMRGCLRGRLILRTGIKLACYST